MNELSTSSLLAELRFSVLEFTLLCMFWVLHGVYGCLWGLHIWLLVYIVTVTVSVTCLGCDLDSRIISKFRWDLHPTGGYSRLVSQLAGPWTS